MANLLIKAFAALCAAVTFAMTLYTIWLVGPAIETAWLPAVSKLTITNITENDDGQAVVTAEFTKLRDCEYLGLAWYRGAPSGGFERVPVILLRREGDNSSPNRPTGFQRAGPWIIGMPVNEIRTNSFAQLSHRCHPFWVTTTNFFP